LFLDLIQSEAQKPQPIHPLLRVPHEFSQIQHTNFHQTQP